uniref:Uncharacterized protein n=1 Tax=Rhizophora mucronata TaxID=61149 RepID=A0A2P2NA16_RHIMU
MKHAESGSEKCLHKQYCQEKNENRKNKYKGKLLH